jgi:hypothetical protein
MAITVSPTILGTVPTLPGVFVQRSVLNVTGLAAGASNTVPHGMLHSLQVVGANNWGPAGGNVTLDNSQGYADGGGSGLRMGYDSTNVYLITAAGVTSCQLTIESGRI